MMTRVSLVCIALTFAGCSASHIGGGDAGDAVDAAASRDAGSPLSDAGNIACNVPTDCVLIPQSCCGDCGAYARMDVVAVHRDLASSYHGLSCNMVTCPGCHRDPDPALVADCRENRCVVLDFYDPEMGHSSEYTECDTDDDCVIRARECCECGARVSPDTVVAIRRDRRADVERLYCEPGTGCPECEPDYGPFFARCSAPGSALPQRCVVDFVGP